MNLEGIWRNSMKLWIAINRKGDITLHDIKPKTDGYLWFPTIGVLDYNPFPEVTFENSPQEVKLVIKK